MTIQTMSEYRAYIVKTASRRTTSKQDTATAYFVAGYTEAARVVREERERGQKKGVDG